MWLSLRLTRGIRLGLPWWLAVPLLPLILLGVLIVMAVDVIAWIVVAPFRVGATIASRPKRGELRLTPRHLAKTIGNLEAAGFTETPTSTPRTRRWTSPDEQSTLTITYDGMGEPLSGAWHGPPRRG